MANKMQKQTPMETLMFLEVRRRYMKYFESDPEFDYGTISMPDFKRYFAEVAHLDAFRLVHHQGKFTNELSPSEREDRHHYNRYFGLVRDKLSAYLKYKKKRKETEESHLAVRGKPTVQKGVKRKPKKVFDLVSPVAPALQPPPPRHIQRELLAAAEGNQSALFAPDHRVILADLAEDIRKKIAKHPTHY